MPYKKYIKKGGKIYGPYTYESRRENGKVVTYYRGKGDISSSKLPKYFILSIFLAIAVYLLANYSPGSLTTTGGVTMELIGDYKPNQTFDGSFKLLLREGELLPADSKVIIDSGGETQEFLLSDLSSEDAVEGEFYIEGASISGSGKGYGIAGEKKIYLPLNFELVLSNSIPEEIPAPEASEEEKSALEETAQASNETIPEASNESSQTSSPSNESNPELNESKSSQEEITGENIAEGGEQVAEEESQKSAETNQETEVNPETEKTTTEVSNQETEEKTTEMSSQGSEEVGSQETSEETASQETGEERAAQEASGEQTLVSEESGAGKSEGGTSEESAPEEAPITGGFLLKAFAGFLDILKSGTTGKVVMEFGDTVSGSVSGDSPFTYTLREGWGASLKPGSVRTENGTALPDDSVQVIVKGNQVKVVTDYGKTEQGFGKEYLGDKTKELLVNLSSLNLTARDGGVSIAIIYGQNNIVSASNLENPVSAQEIEENQTVKNFTRLNITAVEENVSKFELSFDEKQLLINLTGADKAAIAKAEELNGRLIIRYEIGEYWVEFSYDYDGSLEDIRDRIELDRARWLKNLALQLSKNPTEPIPLNITKSFTFSSKNMEEVATKEENATNATI